MGRVKVSILFLLTVLTGHVTSFIVFREKVSKGSELFPSKRISRIVFIVLLEDRNRFDEAASHRESGTRRHQLLSTKDYLASITKTNQGLVEERKDRRHD